MGRERKREGQRGRASNGERAREKAEEVLLVVLGGEGGGGGGSG